MYTHYKSMQHETGFVPQQELVRSKDTVYYTLADAAKLRLPKDIPNEVRKDRVEEVMEIFGLTHAKTHLVQKLSGGQKKRLSIAMELISNPSLFILDEPDSGLDGVMARELMQQLRSVADTGKIVIVITHTPDRVIEYFDDVIVLAKDSSRTGRLAFYGSVPEAREFFGREKMEEIVKLLNREEEGGDGRADEFIKKYEEGRVKSVYRKYQDGSNLRRITGAQAAREILRRNGLTGVDIREISGASLTDYYDPKSNSINLSSDVYNGTSAVAVGVACHEAGHAMQYAADYFPVKVRTAIIPVTNIGSKLAFPLILGGVLLSRSIPYLYQLIYLGIICFGLCTVFQLVTLPTEFDASRRAMECIQSAGILQGEEVDNAGKVLRAAAMTYVAALAVSALQLLRLLSVYGRRRR